jgi:hypothetical protein
VDVGLGPSNLASEVGEEATKRRWLKHGQQKRPLQRFIAAVRPADLLMSELAEQTREGFVLADDALVLVPLVRGGRLERGSHIRVGHYLATIDSFDDPDAGVGICRGMRDGCLVGRDGLARVRAPGGFSQLEAPPEKRCVVLLYAKRGRIAPRGVLVVHGTSLLLSIGTAGQTACAFGPPAVVEQLRAEMGVRVAVISPPSS